MNGGQHMPEPSSALPAGSCAPARARPRWRVGVSAAVLVGLIGVGYAAEETYRAADEGQRPAAPRTEILPERFLRGYDPVTVYFTDNRGPGGDHAPADAATQVKLDPPWPGAWTWVDKRTLQFRPAEAWPPLRRFAVQADGTNRILSTMMMAPTAMAPASGIDELRPFRTFTLTFPVEIAVGALKDMMKLEVRELPGLLDSPRHAVDHFAVAALPRQDARDPASYAITLDEDVPEGRELRVTLALALGDEGKALWTGTARTRLPFHLEEITCGAARTAVLGAPLVPKEAALDCGTQGETPQLVFSAAPRDLTLTALKALVRLEPSVPDLHAEAFGRRVVLKGKFLPDTLYRMRLERTVLTDDEGRALDDPGRVEAYFFLGWKRPFLRMQRGHAELEVNGPRMVPLAGYGEPRADLRIYRIDPQFTGLWPFTDSPLVVDEDSPPPFPGEEPATPALTERLKALGLRAHLRMLGSPLVSKVVDLPLLDRANETRFGLDIGKLLDDAVGARKPGTYLVGVRRLQGPPERSYMRVQITNLSVSAVEERGQATFFVRHLDDALPAAGAKIAIEATFDADARRTNPSLPDIDRVVAVTDGTGKASFAARPAWNRLLRITVEQGEDSLTINPSDDPQRFFANHWTVGSPWLGLLTEPVPAAPNDVELGFVFTERPIYRPGEKVYVKAFARSRRAGLVQVPARPAKDFSLKVSGPGQQEWVLPTTSSPLYGFDAVFEKSDPPTGEYTAALHVKGNTQPLATRRFKVEAYRIPTFEVQLSGPLAARLDGPFKVRALARYYAGGNVAGEKIRWTVTRRPSFYVPTGRDGYLFASSAQFARPDARAKDEKMQKEGKLDDKGGDELEVNPALDLDGSPRTYRFEATVTGADNQEVTSVTEVEARPPFTLGMKLPRYSKEALALKPEIIAVGVDDKLVAGQKVQVRLYKRTWHSHLRESQFATGQASYVTEQEDEKLTETEVQTGAGPIQVKLPTVDSGVFVVELLARDKLGRVQTLSADLYVGGTKPMAWQKSQAGTFELVPDKAKYAPGETANIVVKSPFTKAHAVVILEEPAGNQYRFVDIENGAATIAVPITREHTPNLAMDVLLMRGRLGESFTDDAPYRPQTAAASLDIEVEPVRNKVKVGLKVPDTARPGATVDIGLTLADERGAPLSGEVTLWLVDEAVLSLAKEGPLDPLTGMIVRNMRTTGVLDTRNAVLGRIIDEEAPGGDGDEDERNGVPSRRLRKNFQTVPYYQATVQVPASGKLTVPVALSDDLTNFMVRAVAVSGAERFGNAEERLKVRLPVIVQPQLPRFVRQGDRFLAGGTARLVEGDAGPGAVTVTIDGPVEGAGTTQTRRSKDIALVLDKAQSVLFPVTVGAAADQATLAVRVDVTRKKDGVGDAFSVKIPVRPDRAYEETVSLLQWQDGSTALPAFGEQPRPGTGSRDITATSIPGLLAVVAGLDYVDEYPHGCLEQKLSRLQPQLGLSSLPGLSDVVDGASAKGQIKRFLDELLAHQAEDGLFGYWPGTPGDVILTADVLDFVAAAERAGMPADKTVVARALEGLKRAVRSDFGGFIDGYRFNQQSTALRTLFRANAYDDNALADLFRTRKPLDLVSRTELGQAMLMRPKVFGADIDTLKGELWGSVVFNLDNGTRIVTGVSDPRTTWGGTILGSPTSTLAALHETLVRMDPKNPDNALVFDALLRRAAGGHGFGSTYDNRRALSAIDAYLRVAQLAGGAHDVTITGAGASPGKLHLDAKAKVTRVRLASDAALNAEVKGGALSVRVRSRYLPKTAGDRVRADKNGFVVQRSMTILPASGAASTRLDDTPAAERTLAIGDVVELHTQITTNADRNNVALTVPFAAGFEPLNPALLTSGAEAKPSETDSVAPAYVARLDDEVRYYFSTLKKGTYAFHFRVKATTAGSFVQPPAVAELMYDGAVRGRSDGLRVIVSEEAAAQ